MGSNELAFAKISGHMRIKVDNDNCNVSASLFNPKNIRCA
jgi:hypothetical protein